MNYKAAKTANISNRALPNDKVLLPFVINLGAPAVAVEFGVVAVVVSSLPLPISILTTEFNAISCSGTPVTPLILQVLFPPFSAGSVHPAAILLPLLLMILCASAVRNCARVADLAMSFSRRAR